MSLDVITFGCRLNTYESQAMRRQAEEAGIDNAIIINSCAVTSEAVKQARQKIRRMARENPDRRIIVTGCAAQTEPETFAAMPEVSQVIGNTEKMQAGTWQHLAAAMRPASPLPDFGLAREERVLVNDIMSVKETALHMIDAVDGRARAIVQVQNGCDHRCTFCIIPYGRGPSRSAPMGDVVAQIQRLVENGYREIVITGVDITSYGHDLPGTPKLGSLIRRILRHVPDLQRLRLSSIDSVEVDDDLMDVIANEKRFMPHLHLSLQAGDNMILKRMKRRHLREDSIRFCADIRKLRPEMIFGADLIAGFPTEDETMFANTLALARECGLTHLHVFPYSPRKGTPAAKMPQVAHGLIRERARQLRAEGQRLLQSHLDAKASATEQVLTERGGIGRTEDFTPVKLKAELPPGDIVVMTMAGHDGQHLLAA